MNLFFVAGNASAEPRCNDIQGVKMIEPVLARLSNWRCASAASLSGHTVGGLGLRTPFRSARNTLSVMSRTFSGVSVK